MTLVSTGRSSPSPRTSRRTKVTVGEAEKRSRCADGATWVRAGRRLPGFGPAVDHAAGAGKRHQRGAALRVRGRPGRGRGRGRGSCGRAGQRRSEEHTSELQSRRDLVCRLLLEKKKKN